LLGGERRMDRGRHEEREARRRAHDPVHGRDAEGPLAERVGLGADRQHRDPSRDPAYRVRGDPVPAANAELVADPQARARRVSPPDSTRRTTDRLGWIAHHTEEPQTLPLPGTATARGGRVCLARRFVTPAWRRAEMEELSAPVLTELDSLTAAGRRWERSRGPLPLAVAGELQACD